MFCLSGSGMVGIALPQVVDLSVMKIGLFKSSKSKVDIIQNIFSKRLADL